MATSLLPDPIQFWRDAVTKLEGKLDALLPAKAEAARPARTRRPAVAAVADAPVLKRGRTRRAQE